jgi:hypothetical protein
MMSVPRALVTGSKPIADFRFLIADWNKEMRTIGAAGTDIAIREFTRRMRVPLKDDIEA